jgi:signal peptidase I
MEAMLAALAVAVLTQPANFPAQDRKGTRKAATGFLVRIPTGSMFPTLKVGEYCFLDRKAYEKKPVKIGDIVGFRPPKDALIGDMTRRAPQSLVFISRCVGIAHDVVELRSNRMYRNGKPVKEPYAGFTEMLSKGLFQRILPVEAEVQDFKLIRWKGTLWPLIIHGSVVNGTTETAESFRLHDQDMMDKALKMPRARIPKGYILVMGDNRNGAFDGRSWGLLPVKSVLGTVVKIKPSPTRSGGAADPMHLSR